MTHTTYRDKSRPITTMQKLLELEREIQHREQHYLAKLNAGTMKIQDAALQLKILKAIADDYRKLLTKERSDDHDEARVCD
jgi:hypothetical protein